MPTCVTTARPVVSTRARSSADSRGSCGAPRAWTIQSARAISLRSVSAQYCAETLRP